MTGLSPIAADELRASLEALIAEARAASPSDAETERARFQAKADRARFFAGLANTARARAALYAEVRMYEAAAASIA